MPDPSKHVPNLPTDIDTSVLGEPTQETAKEVIDNLNRDMELEASGIDVNEMAAAAEGGPDLRKICGRGGCTYIPKDIGDGIRHDVNFHSHDDDIAAEIRKETNALRKIAKGSKVPKDKKSKSTAKKKSKGGARRYRKTKRRGTKHRRTKRHNKKTRRKRKHTRRGKK